MKGSLADMVTVGATLSVRVTPRASRDEILRDGPELKIRVTAPPEDGKANAAVTKLLAKALGLPKSRLTLIRGETSRDKSFRIDP